MKSCQVCQASIWLTLMRFETILKFHWKYIFNLNQRDLQVENVIVSIYLYVYKYIIDAKKERTKAIEKQHKWKKVKKYVEKKRNVCSQYEWLICGKHLENMNESYTLYMPNVINDITYNVSAQAHTQPTLNGWIFFSLFFLLKSLFLPYFS